MKIRKPQKIVEARHALDLRQADVATSLTVSQQYISRVERGVEADCSAPFARQLSRLLDLDIGDVFELEAATRVRPKYRRRTRKTGSRVDPKRKAS